MAGSKAHFSFVGCIEEYLRPGTDEYKGCQSFAAGEELNRNLPRDKHELHGIMTGLRKIADGIARDAHLNRVPGR